MEFQIFNPSQWYNQNRTLPSATLTCTCKLFWILPNGSPRLMLPVVSVFSCSPQTRSTLSADWKDGWQLTSKMQRSFFPIAISYCESDFPIAILLRTDLAGQVLACQVLYKQLLIKCITPDSLSHTAKPSHNTNYDETIFHFRRLLVFFFADEKLKKET